MYLRDLVSFVNSAGFDVKDEYERIKALDKRNISFGASRTQAARWSGDNRYGDNHPYDSTRVVLGGFPGSSDYINASWIRGFGERRYIAGQGPLERTAPNFWHMVVEQRIRLIVMLTKVKERGGREKKLGKLLTRLG